MYRYRLTAGELEPGLGEESVVCAVIYPGVGLSKMTEALYPKGPALIPMLDSIVQNYLQDDDTGGQAAFAERAFGLVRGYQRDLDRTRAAVRPTPARTAVADRSSIIDLCRHPLRSAQNAQSGPSAS